MADIHFSYYQALSMNYSIEFDLIYWYQLIYHSISILAHFDQYYLCHLPEEFPIISFY